MTGKLDALKLEDSKILSWEREIYGTSMSRLWAERTTCGTLYFRMLIWCPLYHLMIFSYRSGLICISAGCHLLNMVVMMLHNIHRFVNVLANALRGMFSNFGLWCPFLWGLVKLNTGSISSTCSLSPISRNLLCPDWKVYAKIVNFFLWLYSITLCV